MRIRIRINLCKFMRIRINLCEFESIYANSNLHKFKSNSHKLKSQLSRLKLAHKLKSNSNEKLAPKLKSNSNSHKLKDLHLGSWFGPHEPHLVNSVNSSEF